jgi:hypothetical protein
MQLLEKRQWALLYVRKGMDHSMEKVHGESSLIRIQKIALFPPSTPSRGAEGWWK